jgi:catechol 2,3-dioxygenase-like lactoylglutathione lyase family enzyme
MDMKLEVVPIPVRDVDAARDFYTRQVGFHLDNDVRPSENMRVVQLTPPGSACSVVIGEGLPLGEPGPVKGVQLPHTMIGGRIGAQGTSGLAQGPFVTDAPRAAAGSWS